MMTSGRDDDSESRARAGMMRLDEAGAAGVAPRANAPPMPTRRYVPVWCVAADTGRSVSGVIGEARLLGLEPIGLDDYDGLLALDAGDAERLMRTLQRRR